MLTATRKREIRKKCEDEVLTSEEKQDVREVWDELTADTGWMDAFFAYMSPVGFQDESLLGKKVVWNTVRGTIEDLNDHGEIGVRLENNNFKWCQPEDVQIV